MLAAVDKEVKEGKPSRRWRSTMKVQRTLAVDKESPANGRWRLYHLRRGTPERTQIGPSPRMSEVARGCCMYGTIFSDPERDHTDYKRANGRFISYCTVLLLDLRGHRSFRVKSSFEKTRGKVFFGSVPLNFQIYKYGLLCISGACQGNRGAWRDSRSDHGRARKA